MKESDKQSGPKIQFRYFAIAVIFVGLFSIITSYITVKMLVPALTESTSTAVGITQTDTQIVTKTFTQAPLVEPNLLQNGNFENGLAGWTYTNNNDEGITIFETTGVTGKSYCSRRFLTGKQVDLLNKEQVGFTQEVSIDPTQSYFFSAQIKMYDGNNVVAAAKFYYGAKEAFTVFLNTKASETIGTTNGWFLIQKSISPQIQNGMHTANRAVIGFWHFPINREIQGIVDSTFCVDDIVFRKQ